MMISLLAIALTTAAPTQIEKHCSIGGTGGPYECGTRMVEEPGAAEHKDDPIILRPSELSYWKPREPKHHVERKAKFRHGGPMNMTDSMEAVNQWHEVKRHPTLRVYYTCGGVDQDEPCQQRMPRGFHIFNGSNDPADVAAVQPWWVEYWWIIPLAEMVLALALTGILSAFGGTTDANDDYCEE